MERSLEYKVLRKGATILKDCVSPDDIVTPLFNKDLLTPQERSGANAGHLTPTQRMEKVHLALERRVKVEPTAFWTIIDVLENEPALAPVAEKLRKLWITERPPFPRPAETVGENPELVFQSSPIPRHVVPPESSRFAYSYRGHSSNLTVPKKSSVSPFQVSPGHVSQDYGTQARAQPPVQDSLQDPTKSVMHLTRLPMPLSPTFLEFSRSISDDALKGGMPPERSRKLQDLMREYENLCEHLKNAKAEIARLERYSCSFKHQLRQEREESDGKHEQLKVTVSRLVADLEMMQLKCDTLQTENDQHTAALEQNKELKEVLNEKEVHIEKLKSENEKIAERERVAVKKCKLLEQEARVRTLSDIHYDTTLELDHAFQVILDSKKVSEEFKKKVSVLKVEVERRKNST